MRIRGLWRLRRPWRWMRQLPERAVGPEPGETVFLVEMPAGREGNTSRRNE